GPCRDRSQWEQHRARSQFGDPFRGLPATPGHYSLTFSVPGVTDAPTDRRAWSALWQQGARRAAVISSPVFRVFAVAAEGVLWAFCCVVEALSEHCLCRRSRTSPLVAAVFRTNWLLC